MKNRLPEMWYIWEARAVSMAELLFERGLAEREAFLAEVAAQPADRPYYQRWLAVLQDHLLRRGLLTAGELEARARELERDAEHEHDHPHHHEGEHS